MRLVPRVKDYFVDLFHQLARIIDSNDKGAARTLKVFSNWMNFKGILPDWRS